MLIFLASCKCIHVVTLYNNLTKCSLLLREVHTWCRDMNDDFTHLILRGVNKSLLFRKWTWLNEIIERGLKNCKRTCITLYNVWWVFWSWDRTPWSFYSGLEYEIRGFRIKVLVVVEMKRNEYIMMTWLLLRKKNHIYYNKTK